MGLDNGIVWKTTKENIEKYKDKFDVFISIPDELEITYWRKCWGIRDEIIDILRDNVPEEDLEPYYFPIVDSNELIQIADVLMKYATDRRYYNENARSIWDYDEKHEHLFYDVKKLMELHKIWMAEGPLENVYFYDSY